MTGSLLASPTSSPHSGTDGQVGAQTPRVRNVPPYVKTYGDEVVDFMSEIGRPLDPWQAAITLDAFGVRVDGLWSAFELLILLSRQNGKGGCTEAIELGALFLFREPLIMHSAHQFKTSTAAFRRLIDIIDGSDWLTRRVKQISRSKGDEGIELTRAAGGGRLQFVARTLGSGRGLTGAKNVFDEAAWLTVGQYAAQTPTLATLPNPQIIYTSTPPDEDVGPVPEDAMLLSVRKRGLASEDRIAMYEWSPPPTYDRTDRRVWYDCNPALGIRISEWFLAKQLDAFTQAGKPGKFDTEHLGAWPPDASEGWVVIPEANWQSAHDPASTVEDPVCFAIATNLTRTWASIAIAGKRADGLRHLEVIERRPSVAWVVPRIRQLTARWPRNCGVVLVASGPAGALIPDLVAHEVEVLSASVQDYAKACGALDVGLTGVQVVGEPDPRVVRYRTGDDEQAAALDLAMMQATRHNTGDVWTFDRHDDVDTSPLEAITCALWGFTSFGQNAPQPPVAGPSAAVTGSKDFFRPSRRLKL